MRAIVVSRYPVCLDGVIRLVAEMGAFENVDGYGSLDEALVSASQKPVNLLIIDSAAGDPEFEQLKQTVAAVAVAPVVLFAMLDPVDVQWARDNGVKGCIPKTAPRDLLTAALKLILAGGLYFSDIAEQVAKPRPTPGLRSRLSTRQLEVLRLIEIGHTNKEIAQALGISVATVKLHVQAILNVTGARNRTEAALRARGQIR